MSLIGLRSRFAILFTKIPCAQNTLCAHGILLYLMNFPTPQPHKGAVRWSLTSSLVHSF